MPSWPTRAIFYQISVREPLPALVWAVHVEAGLLRTTRVDAKGVGRHAVVYEPAATPVMIFSPTRCPVRRREPQGHELQVRSVGKQYDGVTSQTADVLAAGLTRNPSSS